MSFDLVIIGGGNMGEALLGGLVDSGVVDRSAIAVVDPDATRRAAITESFDVAAFDAPPPAESALIAVKPQYVPEAISGAVAQGAKRILSIAAGVTTATMVAAAGNGVAIVRAMPNTPALVRRGVSAICAGASATEADLDWAETLLTGVGIVVRVTEQQIDAVTGLTGSGPAYVFLIAESLIEAGVKVGLPRELVEPMVSELLAGSSQLLADRGDPTALRVAVTSPGGTTERGLETLREHRVPEALAAAVRAATERGRELGAS